MPHAISLSLALVVAFWPSAVHAAEPGTQPPTLTPSLRDRLDHAALRLPGVNLGGEIVRAVAEIPERLFPSDEVTPEAESRRAADAHGRLLDCRPASVTPPAAQRVFDRLVAELPGRLKPAAFHYRLTVLDRPSREAFTVGGGQVYVTPAELDVLADADRGEAALAFVLAEEIAHNALGHTRCAWAWQDAVEGVVDYVPVSDARRFLIGALTAEPGRFTCTAAQREEADCFALHLCRNADFDLDAALDSVRLAAVGRLGDKDDGQTTDIADEDGTLHRLRRLLMERDGLFGDDPRHGLFTCDRDTGRLIRCRDGQIGQGERPIIFAHGLRGADFAFADYLHAFAQDKGLAGRPLLVFRYPNNESLSRCGEFLVREMHRCVADPDKAIFVCHSAGGLVFRWYAEVRHGGFDRTIFLATPFGGTIMARLKILVDVGRFFMDLPHGVDFALADEFQEGHGEIAHDLAPDSLFLRRLGREKPLVEKYQIFYGQLCDNWQGVQYQVEFALAMQYLKDLVAAVAPFPTWQPPVRRFVGSLTLPEEIAHGDLAVSAASAKLAGVKKATSVPLMHESFRTDPEMIRR
ncbi:MAG TPA: M48 family metalloprotease, partial [Gemmataceae bacterium]|nr:M48 family metalloprotease [Gemmataceae bacterium]